jgi:hypothetical protein
MDAAQISAWPPEILASLLLVTLISTQGMNRNSEDASWKLIFFGKVGRQQG